MASMHGIVQYSRHLDEAFPFSRLSPEVVVHILGYVEPSDILSFRKTCRNFHTITQIRVIWTRALGRLCERYGLFKPTFPMDRMTLLELEHAATSPRRLTESMTYFDEQVQLLPFQSRIHPLRSSDESIVVPHRIRAFVIVPGGRFLLTEGRHIIHLWDLGYNPKQYLRPWPLFATCPFEPGCEGSLRIVTPTEDGEQLLVAAEVWETYNGSSVAIYQVDPTAKDVGFRHLAKLDLSLPEVTYQLSNDNQEGSAGFILMEVSSRIAVIWCSPYFIVWDWVKNTGCKWKPENIHIGYKPKVGHASFSDYNVTEWAGQQAFILKERQSIVLLDNNSMHIWDIPTTRMTPRFPIVANDFETHNIALAVGGAPWITAATRHWQSGPGGERICVLSVGDESSFQTLHLLSVRGGRRDSVAAGRAIELVKEGIYGVGDLNERFPALLTGVMSGLSQLEEHVVFGATCDGDRLNAVFLYTPRPGTQEKKQQAVVMRPLTNLRSVGQLTEREVGFCAATGRLVYISPLGQLIISDYLAPPVLD